MSLLTSNKIIKELKDWERGFTYHYLGRVPLPFWLQQTLSQSKIIAHFLHSVKWLKTRSLGRTVWFADQVAQLLDIPDISSYPKLRLSDDCPHCCKSGGARGTPTLTVFRPADFKSAMASNYIIAPKFKEHAQSTRDYAPVKGKNLVVHEKIEFSFPPWKGSVITTRPMDR